MIILLDVPDSIANDILSELAEYVKFSQGSVTKQPQESMKDKLARIKRSQDITKADKQDGISIRM